MSNTIKTAEEILTKRIVLFPDCDSQMGREGIKRNVLAAMEEYKNQFSSPAVSDEEIEEQFQDKSPYGAHPNPKLQGEADAWENGFKDGFKSALKRGGEDWKAKYEEQVAITQEWVDEYVIIRDHCASLAHALEHMLWMSDKWGKEWFDKDAWDKKNESAQALDNYKQMKKSQPPLTEPQQSSRGGETPVGEEEWTPDQHRMYNMGWYDCEQMLEGHINSQPQTPIPEKGDVPSGWPIRAEIVLEAQSLRELPYEYVDEVRTRSYKAGFYAAIKWIKNRITSSKPLPSKETPIQEGKEELIESVIKYTNIDFGKFHKSVVDVCKMCIARSHPSTSTGDEVRCKLCGGELSIRLDTVPTWCKKCEMHTVRS